MHDSPKFAVGDRVKVVSLITQGLDPDLVLASLITQELDPDLGLDQYTDKVGKVGTVHDITVTPGTDITVYRLRFDHPQGSVLVDPFFDDELEAVR